MYVFDLSSRVKLSKNVHQREDFRKLFVFVFVYGKTEIWSPMR